MWQHFSHILLRTPLQSLKKAYRPTSETRNIFLEGLYLSSPEYWDAYQNRAQLSGKDKEKEERSFAKYWLRSCTRCTPYGTFAGTAMVDIQDGPTRLVLSPNDQHTRCLRLDMNCITGIIQALEQIPAIRQQIRFYTNNSLYELPEAFRYAEYSIKDNTRHYELTSVAKTTYLKALLKKAQAGTTLPELIGLLCSLEMVTEAEAEEFINGLVQAQLLVSELEPCVTGKEPLGQVIERLKSLDGASNVLDCLKEIQSLMQCPQEGVDTYILIEEKLKTLELAVEVPKNTLQADLFLSIEQNKISNDLIRSITQQAGALSALSRPVRNQELETFRKNFYDRYEEEEVPLVMALDADLGIGYAGIHNESAGGAALIDDIGGYENKDSHTTFDHIQQYALSKYNDYLQHNRPFIELSDEELKKLEEESSSSRFAMSAYLMGSLLKKDNELSAEQFQFDLSSMVGPSAGNLLGRFTHGNAQLCHFTREILQKEEENEDALYAEIVHLPQARIGNILLRPILRKYEIPYIGRSGAAAEDQIPVSDLMVSIRNNEIVLRSRQHNKRVIPRLTTAHNYTYKSLPIYKFLCDLQMQELSLAPIWDWGNLSSFKHLPRVVYKNIILHKAIWKVAEQDIQDLPEEQEKYQSYFEQWRDERKMPQRLVYKEGDNELLIDFSEDVGIDLFLHYIRRYKNILLEEFLFTEENCVVRDTEGAPFTNEMIIPLFRENKKDDTSINTAAPAIQQIEVTRKFAPFSQWLYFKIYCGNKTAECLLKGVLLEFVEKGLEQKWFEHFFFIRYKDDHPHIRLRFDNSDPDKQFAVQKQLMLCLQPFLDSGSIHKIALDTYTRELERYDYNLMEEAELLFHNDSLAIMRFINMLEENDGERYRLLFALRGIDMLLNDFHLTLEDKLKLAKQLQHSFFKEFSGGSSLQKLLNDKYRACQKDVFGHMDTERDVENGIDEAVGIFEIRSEENAPVIESILRKLKIEAYVGKTLFELLPSYIHMFMNRLFIAQQRKYELVVYHFLERYYTSQVGMAKKRNKL